MISMNRMEDNRFELVELPSRHSLEHLLHIGQGPVVLVKMDLLLNEPERARLEVSHALHSPAK